MNRSLNAALLSLCGVLLAGCSPEPPAPAAPPAENSAAAGPEAPPQKDTSKFDEKPFKSDGKPVKTASGLQYEEMTIGTGVEAKPGMQVLAHYTGTLKDGTKFDSSRDRGQPFGFQLGAGMVIKGWDEGIAGMKVGGRRKLIVPGDLAYGPNPPPGAPIPPNATLIFDVELMDAR
jgi:peptidylprolyl isomerase